MPAPEPPAEKMIPEEITQRLFSRPLPPLVPEGVYDTALTGAIDAADVSALVQAGLHLLNDDLPRSHVLAQGAEGNPLADYCHAIVHRREGDYDNSRYWFRRVGPLALLGELYGPDGDAPGQFVERCRRVGRGRDEALEQFQQAEMTHLLETLQAAAS